MAMKPFGSLAPFSEPLWYSRGHSPYYRESHRRLRNTIRRYVDEELRPFAEDWEREGEIPPHVFRRHAELGYFVQRSVEGNYNGGVTLPAEIMAKDWDGFHSIILNDELARIGYYGILMGLGGGNAIGCPPILNYGSESQKQRFLPGVARGDIRFCLGITEPDAGSDVSNIRTTAKRVDGEYIVNGSKKWITNGIWANFCTTAVRTGNQGRSGISLLIVSLSSPGVTRRRMENSGVRASGSTFIEFEDVHVPLTNLIGQENQGFAIIMSNFNPERLGLACSACKIRTLNAHQGLHSDYLSVLKPALGFIQHFFPV